MGDVLRTSSRHRHTQSQDLRRRVLATHANQEQSRQRQAVCKWLWRQLAVSLCGHPTRHQRPHGTGTKAKPHPRILVRHSVHSQEDRSHIRANADSNASFTEESSRTSDSGGSHASGMPDIATLSYSSGSDSDSSSSEDSSSSNSALCASTSSSSSSSSDSSSSDGGADQLGANNPLGPNAAQPKAAQQKPPATAAAALPPLAAATATAAAAEARLSQR